MENEIITLVKRKKKGLLRIVFSRVGIVAVLMAVQFYIVYLGYRWFEEYFKLFALVQLVFSISMIFYLFNCDMDSSAKLTWLNLIMLFPVPATIMLWYTRQDIGHRMIKWRVEELIAQSRGKIRQDSETIKRPELIDSGTDDLSRYLCRTGIFPVYEHTQVQYFPLGEDKFAAMLEELKKAERFIFMEYFIVDEGYMWGSILKILADKAAQGVDVRVMYDGMCEVSLLPHDYPKRLEKLGIRCKPFTPISPFISTQYNYRDHRKILVIDGKVAFNGGVNLADEYINKIERFGHWKDTALMLTGEAVQSFTLLFLQMWNISEKEPEWDPFLTPYKAESDGFVMPYGDCPLDDDKVGEMVYMDILNRAKSYVHIMTPYLILDNELETALKFAAQRGVDVKIILPGIPDKKAAYALAKTHYRSLVKAGVKLYEYTPGFVHAKVFVSDQEKAVVGTINLDYRSLYHHFECATYLYRTGCIPQIAEDFEATLARCRRVTPETIRKEKLSMKILGGIMKLIAPLM
ncbi:MAG: cardiolipin synthase [Oscillospiraceae bacterium]|nr:cardiolipin synthase [Oscillospiraceae bacterium]